MSNCFESKEAFKEAFKANVSNTYGRDFEDTYEEEVDYDEYDSYYNND